MKDKLSHTAVLPIQWKPFPFIFITYIIRSLLTPPLLPLTRPSALPCPQQPTVSFLLVCWLVDTSTYFWKKGSLIVALSQIVDWFPDVFQVVNDSIWLFRPKQKLLWNMDEICWSMIFSLHLTYLRLSTLVDIHKKSGEVGIKVSCVKFKVEIHKRRFTRTAVYFKMATSSNPLSLIVQAELLTVQPIEREIF